MQLMQDQTTSKPSPSSIVHPVRNTSKKVKKSERIKAAAALAVTGLTQQEIAKELGVSSKSIQRYQAESKDAIAVVNNALNNMTSEISQILSTKQRAEKYAKLAIDAKNEAVSLAALGRIDDLEGIVTEKERIRAKAHDSPQVTPLFVLPAGATVQVSVGRPRQVIETKGEESSE
jgi:transposase